MQLEIALPDENGRLQILNIHTAKMAQSKKLSPDVDLKELAARTKNFSGAEIEGLCRAAAFTAMYQLVKVSQFSISRVFRLTPCIYTVPLKGFSVANPTWHVTGTE